VNQEGTTAINLKRSTAEVERETRKEDTPARENNNEHRTPTNWRARNHKGETATDKLFLSSDRRQLLSVDEQSTKTPFALTHTPMLDMFILITIAHSMHA
jgi:hypothetical protein